MKKVSPILAFMLVLFASCSEKTTVYEDEQSNVSVQDNQDFLNKSISYENAGVLDISSEEELSGKTSKDADPVAGDYPLSLIAQITPPSFPGGENLTATHVNIVDDIAYVSYNTVASDYVGAIDAIDVSNPYSPQITSRLYYTNADINAIAYDNGYIYIVGGVDSEKSVAASTNSFVAKIPATNGKIDVNSGITYGFQEGFIGTDIAIDGNSIYVTSGKDGVLAVYDKNSVTLMNETPLTDLRSVTTVNNNIAVLDASKGVSIFDTNFSLIKEIAISSDFGIAAKRTLDFSQDKIYVSEGSKGAGIYNATSGAFIEYISILINPEGSDATDNVTNAVAVNENAILMANGGAGLSLSEESSNSTSPVGIIDLEGSINFVASKGDYIFAASGTAGLQIIKMNKPNQSLETKCEDLTSYRGSSNLVVATNEIIAYQGSKRLNKINVAGELLLCGTWTVSNDITLDANSLFEMKGAIYVGNNRNKKNITVGSNATLRIEGDLAIYGDLILEDGATLEFLGSSSRVYITGNVTKAETAEVTGEYNDLLNKF
ncbi:hypothetical protein Celal_3803 [Cellulophaga algicola DSM 14237]|uniref:LVIVD repeat-containing protein n=1 Tax=Cellulophaga algicola (strain DSM 14237 / IC166 / ACAM 630) TaxID=688270 RepID=E6XBD9_CELAD|nr:hypothetical protein [Cellulophaga algicola]ADV51052.1 hypothetical protein Celal_3803 [Cellulophaga algicola DSM 14237]